MLKLITSIRHAINGIVYAIATERNLRIQGLIFILALTGLFVFNVSKSESLIILGISALVFSLELINTAIERLVDEVSPEYRNEIGIIKDVMAGAVMVASIFAITIGLIIFYEPTMHWLRS